jgi:hypothetical protein
MFTTFLVGKRTIYFPSILTELLLKLIVCPTKHTGPSKSAYICLKPSHINSINTNDFQVGRTVAITWREPVQSVLEKEQRIMPIKLRNKSAPPRFCFCWKGVYPKITVLRIEEVSDMQKIMFISYCPRCGLSWLRNKETEMSNDGLSSSIKEKYLCYEYWEFRKENWNIINNKPILTRIYRKNEKTVYIKRIKIENVKRVLY